LYASGGAAAVNQAFRRPPTSELDILNPAAYLGKTAARPVAPPALPTGSHRVGSSDSFGAFDVYMTLAGYMDARPALIAADGVRGGAFIQYRQNERTCTRVALAGSTDSAAEILHSALTVWAAALPLHQATIASHGRSVTISACDPGKGATAGSRARSHALDIADDRNSNLGAAFSYGVSSPQVALCVGDQALGDAVLLDAEQAANQSYRAPSKAVQSTIDAQTAELITRCQGAHPPASP